MACLGGLETLRQLPIPAASCMSKLEALKGNQCIDDRQEWALAALQDQVSS